MTHRDKIPYNIPVKTSEVMNESERHWNVLILDNAKASAQLWKLHTRRRRCSEENKVSYFHVNWSNAQTWTLYSNCSDVGDISKARKATDPLSVWAQLLWQGIHELTIIKVSRNETSLKLTLFVLQTFAFCYSLTWHYVCHINYLLDTFVFPSLSLSRFISLSFKPTRRDVFVDTFSRWWIFYKIMLNVEIA